MLPSWVFNYYGSVMSDISKMAFFNSNKSSKIMLIERCRDNQIQSCVEKYNLFTFVYLFKFSFMDYVLKKSNTSVLNYLAINLPCTYNSSFKAYGYKD